MVQWINHVPPRWKSTFRESGFNQKYVCKFITPENVFYWLRGLQAMQLIVHVVFGAANYPLTSYIFVHFLEI